MAHSSSRRETMLFLTKFDDSFQSFGIRDSRRTHACSLSISCEMWMRMFRVARVLHARSPGNGVRVRFASARVDYRGCDVSGNFRRSEGPREKLPLPHIGKMRDRATLPLHHAIFYPATLYFISPARSE